MVKISNTGYWDAKNAHHHHVHSYILEKNLLALFDKELPINDFGAGLGMYSKFLTDNGHLCYAYEGDPPPKAVFPLQKQDLTVPFEVLHKGNTLCLEVGEHIPPEYETVFLENLAENTLNMLVLSWAIPGQTGVGHVNELMNGEVVERLTRIGFVFNYTDTDWLRSFNYTDAPWFNNSLLVFEKL